MNEPDRSAEGFKISIRPPARIGVVGPCSAGKSTLIAGLKEKGLDVRHIAQEHSYVPDMWRQITNPDILIFLDVSFPVSQHRRPLDWQIQDFIEQQSRLEHARQQADLLINTDDLSIQDVLNLALTFLRG